MKIFLFVIVSVVLFACGDHSGKPKPYKESRELVPNPEGYKKDSFISPKTDSPLNKTNDSSTTHP